MIRVPHRLFSTISIVLILLSWFSFGATVYARERDKIVLAVGEFPPHIGEHIPENGTFSQIVRRAFDLAGYDIELRFYPWKRSYSEARDLAVDGTYSWSLKPERQIDFAYSNPIFVLERRVFVMRTSSIRANSEEELTGLRLCRPLAYAVHRKFERMLQNQELVLVRPRDMVSCFKFMQEGRVDFIELAYEEGITSSIKAMGTLDLVRTLDFIPGGVANSLLIPISTPKKKNLCPLLTKD